MIVCDEKLGVCSVVEVDLKDELELEQPTLFYKYASEFRNIFKGHSGAANYRS